MGEANGAGTVEDSAGRSPGIPNNGVNLGQASAAAITDGNLAATFDGTNDQISIANTGDWPSGLSGRTVCAWAKPTNTAAGNRWVFTYGRGDTSKAFVLGMNGTTIYGGGYGDSISSAGFWAAGTWKHVCLSYDGTTAKLYGNGTMLTSGAKTWPLIKSAAYIGAQVNNTEFWNGSIDEVMMFDRALSDADITNIYNATTYAKFCRSQRPLKAGAWQHVGGTYDGTKMKLFVDGVEQCTLPVASGFTTPGTNMTLGGKSDGGSAWQGDVMDLKLYNAASNNHVVNHYKAAFNRAYNDTFCYGTRLTNAPFATGSAGTVGDPHRICTIDQLYAIDDNAGQLTNYYKLMSDLDLTTGPGLSIGTNVNQFTGNFDGQMHTISNLKINSASAYQGLFAYIGSGGTVQNLILDTASVVGDSYVGAVAGYSIGTIYRVGIGDNSNVAASIISWGYAGGIVGSINKPGVVEQSYVKKAVVQAYSRTGGIAGQANGTALTAGNFPSVKDSYSHATVIGASGQDFGGIIGQANYAILTNNYFAGIVDDTNTNDNDGGIIGINSSSTSSTTSNFFDQDKCSFDNGFCKMPRTNEIRGLSTARATKINSYVGAGWDFTNVWTTPGRVSSGQYPNLIWEPGQAAFITPPTPANTLTYAGGNGSVGTPFLISTTEQFLDFVSDKTRWANGNYFRLTTNIDIGGIYISPIGNAAVQLGADFNGQGYTLSNYKILGVHQSGLFGQVATNGKVSNLLVTGAIVSGDDSVGGVVGYNYGNIYRVGLTGTNSITGIGNDTGGIVGTSDKPSVIEECFVKSGTTMTGWARVGGIVGTLTGTAVTAGNFSTIKNSYSHANVNATFDRMGGVVGSSWYGTILNNYSAGVINDTTNLDGERGVLGSNATSSTINGNFYDNNVCSRAAGKCEDSDFPEAWGIPTGLAKTIRPYVGATWDFTNVWTTPGQVSSGEYPVLIWEAGQAAFGTPPTPANTLSYSGGNGTVGTPYLISDIDDWDDFSFDRTRWVAGTYFKLTGNINFGGAERVPVGSNINRFAGEFNGDNFTLSNFTIKYLYDSGLFGFMASSGRISNVILSDITIGGGDSVGGLVGYNFGNIKRVGISGASTIGALATGTGVGGLVGTTDKPSIIEECFLRNTVTINGYNGVGAVAGQMTGTAVTAGNFSTVKNCYSHANVNANFQRMGGIVGASWYGQILNNYSAGITNDTSNTDEERGVLGSNLNSSTLNANFYDQEVCSSAIGNCADIAYSEANGLQTAYAKSIRPYVAAGWDFATIWTTPGQVSSGQYPVLIWEPGQAAFGVTPTVANTITYSGGTGTVGTPFLLSSAADFDDFAFDKSRWVNSTVYFKLTASVGLGGIARTPIGNSLNPFAAQFDGQKYIISNLVVSRTSYAGLFGYIASTGRIDNLILNDITISGTDYIGGIAGYSSGNLKRVGVGGTSTITASNSYTGAIVGMINKPSMVEECYASENVTVTGSQYAGGIAGGMDGTATTAGNFSTIKNCYSKADVIGQNFQRFGGIAGGSWYGLIQNNYAAGIVNDTNGSDAERGILGYNLSAQLLGNFYDTTVCASASSYCSTLENYEASGIPTTRMKKINPYVGVGWDFVNVWTTPGTVSSGEYPVLIWEPGQSAFAVTPTVGNTLLYTAGDGTSGSPFQIANANDYWDFAFDKTRWADGIYFTLSNNINFAGETLIPIGNPANKYLGNFNGTTKILSNFKLAQNSYTGLFGSVGDTGLISYLMINDVTLNATDYGGGMVGDLSGKIFRVGIGGTSNLIISGTRGGGLVGNLYKPGIVEESYGGANVSVSGHQFIGGLVGYGQGTNTTAGNFVTIKNSYYRGNVTGNNFEKFGGIVGYHLNSKVEYNYASGIVNDTNSTNSEGGIIGAQGAGVTVTANYYDGTICASASGYCATAAVAGTTAYTTAQMQDSANFGAWDFAVTPIWVAPGGAYFKLNWEP